MQKVRSFFQSISLRARIAYGMVLGTLGLVAVAAPAGATVTYDPTDPTAGTAESTLTSVQNWVANHGAPLIAGLIFIGLAFILLFKYVRRGAHAA